MANSKLRQIIKIVKEITISPSQSRYDISGLDLSLVKFFYRNPQQTFEDLPLGDYMIDTSNNAQTLVIQNQTLLQSAEAIQVCYILSLQSSEYVVDFNVDINTLKNNYNKAVEDIHGLWQYVQGLGFVADESNFSIILPQLEEGEVWVKTADSWKGFQVGKLEQEIQNLLNQINTAATNALSDISSAHSNALLAIQSKSDFENTRLETTGNNQVDRMNSRDTVIASKLDMMERMMSVVSGANRYLDGSHLEVRDTLLLERTADGKLLEDRVGLSPKRIYDGGLLEDRVVDIPLSIDLGSK